MFGLLGYLLIIPLLILFFVLFFFGAIVRLLFGFGKRSNYSQSQSQQRQRQQSYNPNTESRSSESYSSEETITSAPQNRKKVFGKDEGEYTDFEEVLTFLLEEIFHELTAFFGQDSLFNNRFGV